MGDLGPFAILALVWWIFSAVMESRQKNRRRQAAPPRTPRPEEIAGAPPSPVAGAPDATQQEGGRLEQILREFERALEESTTGERQPAPAGSGGWDTGENDDEETEALDDYEPQVGSYEELDQFGRRERELISQDADAEALVQRRTAYAEERARGRLRGDHAEFDARIREPVPETAAEDAAIDAARLRRLQQAIVWREVLGPPVSLRNDDRR